MFQARFASQRLASLCVWQGQRFLCLDWIAGAYTVFLYVAGEALCAFPVCFRVRGANCCESMMLCRYKSRAMRYMDVPGERYRNLFPTCLVFWSRSYRVSLRHFDPP